MLGCLLKIRSWLSISSHFLIEFLSAANCNISGIIMSSINIIILSSVWICVGELWFIFLMLNRLGSFFVNVVNSTVSLYARAVLSCSLIVRWNRFVLFSLKTLLSGPLARTWYLHFSSEALPQSILIILEGGATIFHVASARLGYYNTRLYRSSLAWAIIYDNTLLLLLYFVLPLFFTCLLLVW